MGNIHKSCWRYVSKKQEDYYLLDYPPREYGSNSEKRKNSFLNRRFGGGVPETGSLLCCDTVGLVVSYITSSRLFFRMISLNKSLRNYIIKQNPICARNVVFKVHSNCSSPKKFFPYVFILHLDLLKSFKDSHLKYFPNLEHIRIWQCNSFRGKVLLKYLTDLKYVELIENNTINDGFLIQQSRTLEYLKIDNAQKITDVGICVINGLKKLQLCRTGKNISPKSFSKLTNLESLELQNLYFTDLKVKNTNLVQLRCLSLEHFQIQDNIFFDLPNLVKLKLKYCDKIKGNQFFNLGKLEVLKLYWCDYIEKDMPLPLHLKIISLKGIINYNGKSLSKCEFLKVITLHECTNFREESFKTLSHLRKIKIVECQNITRNILEIIPNIQNIEKIDIRKCEKITNQMIKEYIHELNLKF